MNALDAKDIVMNKRYTGCTDKVSRATLRLMETIVVADIALDAEESRWERIKNTARRIFGRAA